MNFPCCNIIAAVILLGACSGTPTDPTRAVVGSWRGTFTPAPGSTFGVLVHIDRVTADSVFGECRLGSPNDCMVRGRLRGDSLTYTQFQVEDAPQHFSGLIAANELRGELAIGYCPGCPSRPIVLHRE